MSGRHSAVPPVAGADRPCGGERVVVGWPRVGRRGDRWRYSWDMEMVTDGGARIGLGGAAFSSHRPLAEAGCIGNAALVASLVPLMRLGLPVTVLAPVCPELLRNLDYWQESMSQWHPRLARVPVAVVGAPPSADRDPPAGPEGRGEAAFLSMGVSSWHMVGRLRPRLSELVHVDGLAAEPVVPGRRIERRQCFFRAAEQMGISPTWVETDAAGWLARWAPPELTQGALLGAVAMLLEGRCRVAHQGSRATTFRPDDHGFSPLIQPLLSSGLIRVNYEGGEFERESKLLGLLDDRLALSCLHVCEDPATARGNCGRCPKCVWTMLTLEVLADPSLVNLFPPGGVTPEMVAQLPAGPAFVRSARELLKLAQWMGMAGHPLALAVERRWARDKALEMMEPETGALARMGKADWRRLARHHREDLARDMFDHAPGLAEARLLPAVAKVPREVLDILAKRAGTAWIRRRLDEFDAG